VVIHPDVAERFALGAPAFVHIQLGHAVREKACGAGAGLGKGVYLSIPFDTLLTGWSPQQAVLAWQPLIRDGGARLARMHNLWTLTQVRDEVAWRAASRAEQVDGWDGVAGR
jgi:hypothetical protein